MRFTSLAIFLVLSLISSATNQRSMTAFEKIHQQGPSIKSQYFLQDHTQKLLRDMDEWCVDLLEYCEFAEKGKIQECVGRQLEQVVCPGLYGKI